MNWDRQFLWHFRAKLLDVHDGDTVTVLADTGFRGRHEVKLRIARIWAPELSMVGGEDAKQVLIDILSWRAPGDWPLRVVTLQRETVVSEVTSFERYVGDLAVVSPTGDLVNVATEMAKYGYDKPI